MIKGLLQKNPDLRLSADDVLHHPWVLEMKSKLSEHHGADHLDLNSEKIYPDICDKKAGYEGLKSTNSEEESDWVRPESHTVEREVKKTVENKEAVTQETQESETQSTTPIPTESDSTGFVVSEKAADKQETEKKVPSESDNLPATDREVPSEVAKTDDTMISSETDHPPATNKEVPVEVNKENDSSVSPETAETCVIPIQPESDKIDNPQVSPQNGDPPDQQSISHAQTQEKPVDVVL